MKNIKRENKILQVAYIKMMPFRPFINPSIQGPSQRGKDRLHPPDILARGVKSDFVQGT